MELQWIGDIVNGLLCFWLAKEAYSPAMGLLNRGRGWAEHVEGLWSSSRQMGWVDPAS